MGKLGGLVMEASKACRVVLLVLACGLADTFSSAETPEQQTGGEFSLEARVESGGPSLRAAGGVFELRADVHRAALMSYGGEYVLGAKAGVDLTLARGCECLCAGTIFGDGFESGDTTAWSVSVP